MPRKREHSQKHETGFQEGFDHIDNKLLNISRQDAIYIM